jgi:hypothetical protein
VPAIPAATGVATDVPEQRYGPPAVVRTGTATPSAANLDASASGVGFFEYWLSLPSVAYIPITSPWRAGQLHFALPLWFPHAAKTRILWSAASRIALLMFSIARSNPKESDMISTFQSYIACRIA